MRGVLLRLAVGHACGAKRTFEPPNNSSARRSTSGDVYLV